MLEKGKKVGEYVLLEKLGAGGFGDVWKAEKRTVLDSNHFALKFFRPKEDGVDFDKIGKELAVWKQLRGLPHIISVIELDRFEDYVYVVSDFADGGSLEKYLNKNGKARTETEAVQIALEILTGLENLHGKGFVHRDLKPDNILIMNGRFCLADFGISREIKTHSKATGTAGTMEYMPPEAFEENPSITPQTDIWAIGVILQRILTGKLPFSQDNIASLSYAIINKEPDEIPATISEGLREIVKKSLQKNREDRFQSANEMRKALKNPQRFLENRAISQAETRNFEDSDKTEEYIIAPTKDWREIEAEKQRQAETNQPQKPFADWEDGKQEKETGKNRIIFALAGIIAVSIGIIGWMTWTKPLESIATNQSANKNTTSNQSVNNASNLIANTANNSQLSNSATNLVNVNALSQNSNFNKVGDSGVTVTLWVRDCNADGGDCPAQEVDWVNTTVILEMFKSKQTFKRKTDSKGKVTFFNVPCGKARISIEEAGSYPITIPCGKSTVNLGKVVTNGAAL